MFVQIGCLIAILQLTVGFPSLESPIKYDGHKVLEILHKAEDGFLKIISLEAKYELDFWKMPKHSNDTMTIRVGPHHLEDFLHELEAIDADVTTMIEDVQKLVDEHDHSYNHRRATKSMSGVLDLERYNTYATIMNYLEAVVQSTLPNGVIAQVETLGTSYEGRNVDMIKLSKSGGSSSKRKIFVDGGIHAREWVAPATVIYMIEQLAYHSLNADINAVMDIYDIYLVPVVNPDGYEYTSTERLWRKNRRVTTGTSCRGVDLNRNFPYQWAPSVGGSTNPCSDLYSGESAGSEPETKNIVNYLGTNGYMFDAYLTIHAYGQMWLYPWGYTSLYPADSTELEAAAVAGVNSIKKFFQTRYTYGSSTNELYAAAGGSDDYAKGGANIKYAYTIELRDTGRYGFVLPTSLITPTASEFFEGFLAFCNTMHNQILNSGK